MKVDLFDFFLPEHLIAQTPLKQRDESKLLVLDKNSGKIVHQKFGQIVDFIEKDDVLVVNNSRVIPARLFGLKKETGATIELLLLHQKENDTWECLVKPAKRIKVGTVVSFGDGLLEAKCTVKKDDGICQFQMKYEGVFLQILDKLGEMPLPPYIKEKLDDKERYQTVYAKNPGSAAAPTAGLHFTNEILSVLKQKGVKIVEVTLHVGLGTFRPMKATDINDHQMHSEYFELSQDVAEILNQAKKSGNKIISVGTTSTRVLESVANDNGEFKASTGWTDIFIYPGYKFKAVDSLITNFHLPKSTLVMLVSAFSSLDYIKNAYNEAVENEYRFFSFGDSMFITGLNNK